MNNVWISDIKTNETNDFHAMQRACTHYYHISNEKINIKRSVCHPQLAPKGHDNWGSTPYRIVK